MRQQIDVGKAVIDPSSPIVAGAFTTVTLTYTAGHPIDDTGYALVTFRSATDCAEPQFDDPGAPNYCSVRTTGDCVIEPRWDPKGHTRPWSKALYLKVTRGFLNRGEEIIVVYGDTTQGSPGWRMQTFCQNAFEFKAFADPIATFEFKELLESPKVRIVPGEPAKAVCIAPSQIRVGQGFDYALKLEDRWGNVTAPILKIMHEGFSEPGIETVAMRDPQIGLVARSNPIEVVAEDTPLHRYWADLHGQSEETVGTNSIDDHYAFARDFGLLDVAGHQGNDFQVTDPFWQRVNDASDAFYVPGTFVTFPGYEWSGNTPLGGDRNIYFASGGGRIVHSCADLLPGKRTEYGIAPTATELFRELRQQEGPAAFAFAHVGGRYADISMHDPEIELAVEVHSAWGTFEWLVEDALERGYRIGLCANSDDHKCRLGASYPGAGEFGSYGGLTCLLADKLDRESIVAALRARHFYATTGNRCLLDVTVSLADGRRAIMGDVVEAGTRAPHLQVRYVGTAPIESATVRNGLRDLATLRPYGEGALGNRIKLVWTGAEVRGRARMATWDGSLRVRGNRILDVTPINFWNANHQPERKGTDKVGWRSVTTGGVTGVILNLKERDGGSIEIETAQGNASWDISSIGLEPMISEYGGLGKKLEVYRLAEQGETTEFSFTLPLDALHDGDNPIYVRLVQEDGHMAWSSPIYVT